MRVPVYVAGASKAWQRARDMANRLRETGKVEITCDWFRSVELHGAGNDHELSDERRIAYAHGDLKAVDSAVILLVLWDEHRSEGRALELGYVLGKDGVTTVVAGPDTRRCIFTSLVDICIDADVDQADTLAFDQVMGLVAEAASSP